jgi:hypothetical protein
LEFLRRGIVDRVVVCRDDAREMGLLFLIDGVSTIGTFRG